MNCPICGIELNNNALSCEDCGYKFITKKSYKMSPVFIFILVLVAVGFILAYISEGGVNTGQQWCMNIIREFEEDNANITFNEMIYENIKVKKMNSDETPFNTPSFLLREDGSFSCMVPGGGIMFPSQYVYESKHRVWEYTE